MERPDSPRQPPTGPGPALVIGLSDDTVPVGRYFDHFDWEAHELDPEVVSAEDFLAALSD